MSNKNSQKYDLTKEILHKLYIVEGMSGYQIAKDRNINERTVRNYLKKHDFSRTKSEAAMVRHNGVEPQLKLTRYEKEILIGELLGDGSITIDKRNTGDCLPWYRHSSKFHEYLIWLSSIVPNLRWADDGETIHKQIKRNGGGNVKSWHLRSQCHPDLVELKDMFYDSDGNKHIPENLKITSTVLRHWFMGDGSSGYYSAGTKKGIQRRAWQIIIYTCAFAKDELERIIVPQLAEIGIKSTVTNKPGRHRLRICAESHKAFYEYIGNCPVECYSYKWDCSNKK